MTFGTSNHYEHQAVKVFISLSYMITLVSKAAISGIDEHIHGILWKVITDLNYTHPLSVKKFRISLACRKYFNLKTQANASYPHRLSSRHENSKVSEN